MIKQVILTEDEYKELEKKSQMYDDVKEAAEKIMHDNNICKSKELKKPLTLTLSRWILFRILYK